MTYIVKMFAAGKIFEEKVIAANPQDARKTALARNPSATVMGVNVSFGGNDW
jgi:hypothetical protein